MTRLFFDCEFIDCGHHIELLSIGIVRDDGQTYYAEPAEADFTQASPWVKQHVMRSMLRCQPGEDINPAEWEATVTPRAQIAAEIESFAGPGPRWYAYVDHYDWICLSQLYGPLVDRPAHWPWGSINLATLAEQVGIDPEDPEEMMPGEVELAAEHGLILPEGAHHALAGAWWDQLLWKRIQIRAGDDPDYAAVVDS